MTLASRPATKGQSAILEGLQQRVLHSFRRASRSFQIRSPTSLTLVSTSFALVPDSQLAVAINRGQATTALSEHHRKRTQHRSATMFAVFLPCVLRDTLCLTPVMGCAHAWMSGRAYESSLSMSRLVYELKTSAVLWQCGWSGTNKRRKKRSKNKEKNGGKTKGKKKKKKKKRKRKRRKKGGKKEEKRRKTC